MDAKPKQEPRASVGSAEESGWLAKAESWVEVIADEVKEVGDQEARIKDAKTGEAVLTRLIAKS